MTLRNFITILLLTASYSSISAQTLQNFVFLNAELSVQMALTAVQDCQEKGYNVSAAVMNREGRLTAFARNPMASPMTSEIAQGKAYTSAITQSATGNIDIETTQALGFADGVVPTQGGLPFSAGGRFLGGIGVSGADSATDEECAQAGIDSVADDLEFAE
ncbi:MAG: GlcG/HbpS family heme-binding protein [bacterium]|jgi:uncharacterized protein GlcG (DUF336 family)